MDLETEQWRLWKILECEYERLMGRDKKCRRQKAWEPLICPIQTMKASMLWVQFRSLHSGKKLEEASNIRFLEAEQSKYHSLHEKV